MTGARSAAALAIGICAIMVATSLAAAGFDITFFAALVGLAAFIVGVVWSGTGMIVVGLATTTLGAALATEPSLTGSITLAMLGVAAVAAMQFVDASDWLRRSAAVETPVIVGIALFAAVASLLGIGLTSALLLLIGRGPSNRWFIPAAMFGGAAALVAAAEVSRRHHPHSSGRPR